MKKINAHTSDNILWHATSRELRVCLVARITLESLSHLRYVDLIQALLRFSYVFGSSGVLKQATLRCCLVGCVS
jgi:hypothetical protein